MDSDVVDCWHCGFEQTIDFNTIPPFGQGRVCPKCNRPFHVMQPDAFYNGHFSPHISRHILHRKRNHSPDHLETDIKHMLFFEQELAAAGEPLTKITNTTLHTFAAQFLDEKEGVRFKHNFFEMFQLMLFYGELSANPLVDVPPITDNPDEPSVEIRAYVRFRQKQNDTQTLDDDLKEIEILQRWLLERKIPLASCSEAHVSQFLKHYADVMININSSLSVLAQFYDILVQEELVEKNPVTDLSKKLLSGTVPRGQRRRKLGKGLTLGTEKIETQPAPTVEKPTVFTPDSGPSPLPQVVNIAKLPPNRMPQVSPRLPFPNERYFPRPQSFWNFKLVAFFLISSSIIFSFFYFTAIFDGQGQKKTVATDEKSVQNKSIAPVKLSRQRYFLENGLSDYFDHHEDIHHGSHSIKPNPLSYSLDLMEKGQILFNKHCNKCHQSGIERQIVIHSGGGVLYKDTYLFWTLAEGGELFGGAMPGFKKILSDDDIWTLILFLETLS